LDRGGLHLAEQFGATLIRVCMKTEEDIVWARRASDEAGERGIRLAHQSHCASLFETVDDSWRALQAIGRPNFGLIYEPANWMIAGQEYGGEIVRQFQPYLFNVYVQNHILDPGAPDSLPTWTRGRVHLHHVGIWEKGGVDFDSVRQALRDVGYSGFLTVHQAFGGIMPVEEAVRRSSEYLRHW